MTRESKVALLEKLQSNLASIDEEVEKLANVFGYGVYEMELIEAYNRNESLLIDLTVEALEVPFDALTWFIYENRFGKERMRCGIQGEELTLIDSISTFLDFEGA